MIEQLAKLSDRHLLAIYKAAKVRPSLRAIFADPKAMIELRNLLIVRGLVRPAGPYRARLSIHQIMAECDCNRQGACVAVGYCIAEKYHARQV